MLAEQQQQGSFFQFQLEGQFMGFLGKPGKIKYLRLAVGDREVEIKLSKHLRHAVWELKPGDGIQVWGEQKFKVSFQELKLKALGFNLISCGYQPKSTCTSPNSPCPKKGKILLCQKSGCVKRGGKKMYDALKEGLCNLGLEDSVSIQVTSCQKRCKRAPNMVFMPAKAKYSEVPTKEISSLLEKHYLQ